MKPVIYILSTDAEMPSVFAKSESEGKVRPMCQHQLTEDDIVGAGGLIAGNFLDQIDMFDRRLELEAMLNGGGRLVFCGHVLRPFVQDVQDFVPLVKPKRADFQLVCLNDHPIFVGINMQQLEENRGVAGFYGRGYNPPPSDALPLVGIGPQKFPLDWVWHRREGGAVFVHSGNDIWGCGDDPNVKEMLAYRLVDWCLER